MCIRDRATLSEQIDHAAEVTDQLSGIDPKTDKIPGNWKEITTEQLDELQNILQQELINRSSGTLAESTLTNNQLRRIIGQIVSLKYLESLDDLEAFTEFWAVRKGSYLPVPEPDEAAAAELYPLIESRIEDVRNQLAGIGPATSSPNSETQESQARPNEEVFESHGTAGTSLTDPIKDLSVSITREFLGERLEVLTAASAYVRPLGVALHDAYKA